MAKKAKFPLGLFLIGIGAMLVISIGGGLGIKNLAKSSTTTVN